MTSTTLKDAIQELEVSLNGIKDTSYDSIDKIMRKIMKKHDLTAKQLHNGFVNKYEKTPDDYAKEINEDLGIWFGKGEKGGVGGGGWDRYNTKGERIGKCAREPGEPKPKCLSKEKAAKMSKDEIAAAVRRKREADPVADRPGKGGTPKMVSNKIKEEMEEIRYCPMCRKRERRRECSYGPKMWDAVTVSIPDSTMEEAKKQPDHEHSMIRSELETIRKAVDRLKSKMKGEGNVEAWVQSKITKAADYIDSAADYIDSGEHNVHGSMDEAKDDPCWKGYRQVGMKKKGNKMVPNCVKEQSPLVKKILEQLEGERELQALEEKNVPTNPSLWSKMKAKAKAKFDVYPSAYANGWAAKEYKKAGGKWKSVSEEIEIQDAYGETFAVIDDVIKADPIVCERCGQNPCICDQLMDYNEVNEAVRIPSKTGNILLVTLNWRGKYYAMKMFFPQVSMPTRKDVQDQIDKVYPGARVLAYNISDIKPGEQFLQTEDWQKVNRKDKTDGLSQKAVDAYRRENPGSKLQTAVTEKNPKGKRADRRKSFCSRMKGMKKRLTSAETARDPDSRINKALRRWRCN